MLTGYYPFVSFVPHNELNEVVYFFTFVNPCKLGIPYLCKAWNLHKSMEFRVG